MSEQEYSELLDLASNKLWAMKQDLDGWVHQTRRISKVLIELLHRRLGHRSIQTSSPRKKTCMKTSK